MFAAAIDASRGLGIEPVISAKEIADPEVDHLGVMAYAAWFQRAGVRLRHRAVCVCVCVCVLRVRVCVHVRVVWCWDAKFL